jgi:hypothetical protein
VATRHIKEMIDLIARQSPDWGQPAAHERAMVTIATMVGALMLSRAVDEPGLSDSLREAALSPDPPSEPTDRRAFDSTLRSKHHATQT